MHMYVANVRNNAMLFSVLNFLDNDITIYYLQNNNQCNSIVDSE